MSAWQAQAAAKLHQRLGDLDVKHTVRIEEPEPPRGRSLSCSKAAAVHSLHQMQPGHHAPEIAYLMACCVIRSKYRGPSQADVTEMLLPASR